MLEGPVIRTPRRRRWYDASPLYVGLAIGAVLGALAGTEYAWRDLQYALIAAEGRADVHQLSAYALARQAEVCALENPRKWP